jgi:hypothetical protein
VGANIIMYNINIFRNITMKWSLVAHAYNLSYSGDRDQEACSSKPAWRNSS